MNEVIIKQMVKEVREYAINCRRKLHQLPETGGQEYVTSKFIYDELKEMGVDILNVGETGLIGLLQTGITGPHVVLRADMDALMVEESTHNLNTKKVCVSEKTGVSHACGHDAHVAMLLATLKILSDRRDEFEGTIYACFESGEENACGYKEMLDALQQFPIDTCWAIHVYSELESGKICVDGGARMAGVSLIDVTIRGQSAHGASEKIKSNAIFTAGFLLDRLAKKWNSGVSLGITQIQGGDSYNIIPENVRICGTLRYFDDFKGKEAIRFFEKMAKEIARENECEVIFDEKMKDGWAPVWNDFEYANLIKNRIIHFWGEEVVSSIKPWNASETFSHYSRKYPSVLMHLGIKNEMLGTGAPHHTPQFDIDENVLELGIGATLLYVDEIINYFVFLQ